MNTQTHAEDAALLSCWKEIAQYLGKGVRTVQRWEQQFGLPVKRPNGDGDEYKSTVVARREELDAWLHPSWHVKTVRQNGDLETKSRIAQEIDGIQCSRSLREEHITLRLENQRLSLELRDLVQSLKQNCQHLITSNEMCYVEDSLSCHRTETAHVGKIDSKDPI